MIKPREFRQAMDRATTEIMQEKGLTRVSQINNFDCFNWALKVFDYAPGSYIGGHRLDEEGQSFILWQGKCYDSETPEGVDEWWMLRSFQRMMKEGAQRG